MHLVGYKHSQQTQYLTIYIQHQVQVIYMVIVDVGYLLDSGYSGNKWIQVIGND